MIYFTNTIGGGVMNLSKLVNEDTYIISDTHFNHKKILYFQPTRKDEMEKRGYSDHNEMLMDNWNDEVGENDNVLCLGDFAFSHITDATSRLNGNKVLVLGNHDRGVNAYRGWTVVDGVYVERDYGWVKYSSDDSLLSGIVSCGVGSGRCFFSHYPLFSTDPHDLRNDRITSRMRKLEEIYNAECCDLNLHGHSHDRLNEFSGAINCCVERMEFRPKRIGELIWCSSLGEGGR